MSPFFLLPPPPPTMSWKAPKTESFYKLLEMRKKKTQPPDEESGDVAYTLSDASPQLGSPSPSSPSYSPPLLPPEYLGAEVIPDTPQGPQTATETTISPALEVNFELRRDRDVSETGPRTLHLNTFEENLEPLLADLQHYMQDVKSAVHQLDATYQKIMMLERSRKSFTPVQLPVPPVPPPLPFDTVEDAVPLSEANVKCARCGARKNFTFLARCLGCELWFCEDCGMYDPDLIKQVAYSGDGFYCMSCDTPNTPKHATERQKAAARLEYKEKQLKRLQTSKRLETAFWKSRKKRK